MRHVDIVKIGGNVVDNREALEAFIADFAALPGRKILVHGGGKEATRLSERLGIATEMINGRRITGAHTLDIVTMVYAGLVNKRVVALLQGAGCNAVGLSGADGNTIKATRRNPEPVDYGFVGDIDPADVNAGFLLSLLDAGITPVVCAIQHDGHGTLLNCNADTVASSIAVAMSRVAATRLTFCFEKRGVLRDVDNPDSLIQEITPASYQTLLDHQIISSGMIPKVDNAFLAIRQGVGSVCIKSSEELSVPSSGTVIKA